MSRAANFFRRVRSRFSWRDAKQGVVTVVAIQAVVHVMQEYGYFFTWCVGPSMMPTIPGDGATLVFLDTFSYKVQDKQYEVGDVVICASPYDANKNVCKRIAAKTGDYVTVHSRNKHHRVRSAPVQQLPSTVVPPGHVWLAGDNSQNSTDSRTYGPVSIGLIKGKVVTKARLAFPPVVPVDALAWPHDAISVRRAGEEGGEAAAVGGAVAAQLVETALALTADADANMEKE